MLQHCCENVVSASCSHWSLGSWCWKTTHVVAVNHERYHLVPEALPLQGPSKRVDGALALREGSHLSLLGPPKCRLAVCQGIWSRRAVNKLLPRLELRRQYPATVTPDSPASPLLMPLLSTCLKLSSDLWQHSFIGHSSCMSSFFCRELPAWFYHW